MEQVREELYKYIVEHGLNDPRTLAKSIELDTEILKEMSK